VFESVVIERERERERERENVCVCVQSETGCQSRLVASFTVIFVIFIGLF